MSKDKRLTPTSMDRVINLKGTFHFNFLMGKDKILTSVSMRQSHKTKAILHIDNFSFIIHHFLNFDLKGLYLPDECKWQKKDIHSWGTSECTKLNF